MRNKKSIFLFLVFLSGINYLKSQDVQWRETDKHTMSVNLNSIAKYLQNKQQYQVYMTDASFENYTTPVAHEKSSGYVKKEGQKFHNYMMGIHTIQNSKCRLVFDSTKKILIVSDPLKAINDIISDTAFNRYLKVCNKMKLARSGGIIYIKLEFNSTYPLSEMTMTIKDSLVEKIVMYYQHEVKSNNKSAKPRVEITFEKWKMSVENIEEAFNLDTYVYKKGDTYYLKPPYTGTCKLLDQRIRTKTGKS